MPSRNNSIGVLIVISGPSGVGKTTIVREVEKRLGGSFSVSATTRAKSPSETHGKDYFFLSEDEFQRMIDENQFLEYAQVFGRNWYGTPREQVEKQLEAGELVILDIDVQGAQQVKDKVPQAFAIFILPPSEDELLRRLRARARDDEEAIQRRFNEARQEIAIARTSGCYNAFVNNDDLDEAIRTTCELIERHRASAANDRRAARTK
jgi:guanylate kinase